MSSDADSKPSTKDKFASIVGGFDTFDSEMKSGTRIRREKEEFRIAELKMEMKRLDAELVSEIKKRTEMNKSTQTWFEGELSKLNKSFHETLENRTSKTQAKLDVLADRITELDEKFEKEKVQILQEIEARGEELKRMLYEFKEEFEEDKKLRLQREEVLAKQLADHEHEVSEKFNVQIEGREARYQAVRAVLEGNIKLRDRAEARFSSFFEREIHKLHNDVQAEVELREREDDEIVEALNRYTAKLQKSLFIVNSTEM
jgi:hypothetical protein